MFKILFAASLFANPANGMATARTYANAHSHHVRILNSYIHGPASGWCLVANPNALPWEYPYMLVRCS